MPRSHDNTQILGPEDELQGGRYRIIRQLSKGGMGRVYLAANQKAFDAHVAIKENINEYRGASKQFEREAYILAQLNHPHLPKVTEYFEEESGDNGPVRQYLVMDYVEGHDLSEVLRTQGPLSEPEVLNWIRQVMDALIFMHHATDPDSGEIVPIIHRDIKPANIRLTNQTHVVLVDFGIAKHYMADQKTSIGAQAFTPGYASPEQHLREQTDVRSDVYSLGATLFHLLTKQKPAQPTTESIQEDRPVIEPPRTFNRQISANTERVILKAMETNPRKRFQSISEMRDALFSSLPVTERELTRTVVDRSKENKSNRDGDKEDQPTPPPPKPIIENKRAKSRKGPGLLVTLVGLLLIVGTVWALNPQLREMGGWLSLPTSSIENEPNLTQPLKAAKATSKTAQTSPTATTPATVTPLSASIPITTTPQPKVQPSSQVAAPIPTANFAVVIQDYRDAEKVLLKNTKLDVMQLLPPYASGSALQTLSNTVAALSEREYYQLIEVTQVEEMLGAQLGETTMGVEVRERHHRESYEWTAEKDILRQTEQFEITVTYGLRYEEGSWKVDQVILKDRIDYEE